MKNNTYQAIGGSAGRVISDSNSLNIFKGGGAGSGGRIKFIRFNWYDIKYYMDQP